MSAHTHVLVELWPPPGWKDKLTYKIFEESLSKRCLQQSELIFCQILSSAGKWENSITYPGKILGRFSSKSNAEKAKILAKIHGS